MDNYFLRKNDNEDLDKMFYIEAYKMDGRKIILNQLLSEEKIEEIIDEESFFNILKEYIESYYSYKILTKELTKKLCGNLYEVLLDKIYIPYRKLMLFSTEEPKYSIKAIKDFNSKDIDYDYYEYLSYLMESSGAIYCQLKRKNIFNNIIKFFEDLFNDKKVIDLEIKQKYNLPNGFILNFVTDKLLEV